MSIVVNQVFDDLACEYFVNSPTLHLTKGWCNGKIELLMKKITIVLIEEIAKWDS